MEVNSGYSNKKHENHNLMAFDWNRVGVCCEKTCKIRSCTHAIHGSDSHDKSRKACAGAWSSKVDRLQRWRKVAVQTLELRVGKSFSVSTHAHTHTDRDKNGKLVKKARKSSKKPITSRTRKKCSRNVSRKIIKNISKTRCTKPKITQTPEANEKTFLTPDDEEMIKKKSRRS